MFEYETFAQIANWSVSRTINESSWIFPLVQAFHLVALGFLSGSLLMVDLRLLGKGFSRSSRPHASHATRDRGCSAAWSPWF
jgi:hypothetical protein